MINIDHVIKPPKSQIINIVRRSLGYIDQRLIDHGDRVAYIADMIANIGGGLGLDRETLLILCLLHDIGAYKTEEIDDMVRFETRGAENHAIYGYVFLRNATTLGDNAEAILYHHTDYDKLSQIETQYKAYAELIFLADRIDILLALSGPGELSTLRALSGSAFSPQLVELFFAAEEKYALSDHIKDLSYQQHIADAIGSLHLSEDEIMSYLRMLVYSIDFRSPFTVTHTANTTSISETLADLFGLSEPERYAIGLGAFLHDIGKLGIPYSILESPGKLSDVQMEIMKTHVTISEDILRGVVSDEVCRIAVRHHEKLDGSGYGRGLAADELTLPERIVAVADVMSALINRRSYKEPFPKEKSIAILERMRDNGELCPQVCNAVIDNFDYIINVTNLSDDPVIELYETISRQYADLSEKMIKNITEQ